MDESGILSFSHPRLERERVEAHPSPNLELAYAYHRLVWGAGAESHEGAERLRPFELLFRDLRHEHPDLLEEIAAISEPGEETHYERELFLLVLDFGYAHDEDPERFLQDLTELPKRFLARLESDPAAGTADSETRHRVHDAMEALGQGGRVDRLQQVLKRLWTLLSSAWEERGRAAAVEACERFAAAFAEKGDVLAALPAHHVAQFEASAEKIRAAQSRDRMEVIPLYFASQGGFIFHLQDAYFIGFGLQVEQAFAHTEARVREIAGKMKAYADPTRLMLVTLLANYGKFTPTVGDLAAQLGVSQPTVSGHLRHLREAGLVRLEKEGTKSFYHLQIDAAVEPLEDLVELLERQRR